MSARVYSRRLSGPQQIHEIAGTTNHFTVPAGHVFVVRFMSLVNSSSSLTSSARVVIAPVGVTPGEWYRGLLPPDATVHLHLHVCFSAGDQLLAYTPVGGALVLSTFGYDFIE